MFFDNKTKVIEKDEGFSQDNGGLSVGIMKTAAVKGIIPPWNKVNELRSNIIRLISETSSILDERFGSAGLDVIAEIFGELGTKDAKIMKDRLGFGDTLRDSLDAWLVIGHILGSKMEPRWISDNRVEVSHSYCPQHEEFMKRGKLYCTQACLPYVGAIGENIGKNVKMDVVRAADENTTCVKALYISSKESE